jgi:uncharacterized protein (TIGR01777 family)
MSQHQFFSLTSPMPVSAAALYDWHARPAAFFRLQPPWEAVSIIDQQGHFGEGFRVTIRAQILGPFHQDWIAEIYDVQPGRSFSDRQLSGPFAEWNHTHRMEPVDDGSSFLHDEISYRLPYGWLGHCLGSGLVQKRLKRMFVYRHALTASDLKRHQPFLHRPRLTVAMTGSSGLIGSDLALFLAAGGHRVIRLGRMPPRATTVDDGTSTRIWRPDEPLNPSLFEGVDAVVHLAGEPIAEGRWTAAKKQRIRQSRVGPTRRLAEVLAAAGVKTLIAASAIGIYGDRGDEELTEASEPGTGFLAEVGREWEAATEPARMAGVRVINLRIGVVLSPRGGALAKQLPAFNLGAGAVLGHGQQWLSWISISDLVGAIHHLLQTETVSGPVNAVAPEPVTNRVFGRVLARVLKRPYLATIPAPMLRLMFGELADAALLSSQRVFPRVLMQCGFAFDHPELEPALRFLLGRG